MYRHKGRGHGREAAARRHKCGGSGGVEVVHLGLEVEVQVGVG